MPQRHTIEVGIVVQDDGSIKVEKFNDKLQKTDEQLNKTAQTGGTFKESWDKFVTGAYEKAGQMATQFLSQLPAQIVELGKLGAQAEAAEFRFTQFAGGAERAEEFLNAFNTATMGTVDKMGAMSSAARLLQMGLVDNTEEMGLVAEMATKLGDQTMGATDRISDFALMMANQSIPRLDNFGISSGRVRTRIKELQAATKDMSREEAFKIAVMEEGKKSLDTLGDTSELAQVKIDKLTAAFTDAKVGLGELIAEVADGAVEVDNLADKIRGLPVTLRQAIMLISAIGDVQRETNKPVLHASAHYEDVNSALKRLILVQQAANIEFEDAAFIERVLSERTSELTVEQEAYFAAVRKAEAGITTYTSQSYLAKDATLAHKKSQSELEYTVLQTIHSLEAEKEALDKLQNVAFNASMQFTDFFRDVGEKEEEFGKTREELEAEHIANLEDIRKKGLSTYVQIDEEGERLQLQILEARLAKALEEQSKFNEETDELTRLQKQQTINTLTTQIAEQKTLLEGAYNGLVEQKGKNVNALIAEEDRRHQAAIAGLEEEMEKTRQLQEQQMGQLLLDTFEDWAEVRDVPPEKMMEMRLAIAGEFGLISDEQALMVTNAMTQWDNWLNSTETTAAATVTAIKTEITVIQDLSAELGRLPTQKEITIRINYERAMEARANVPEETYFNPVQHGFAGMVGPGFGGPRGFLAGEGAYPERVLVQPTTQNEFNLTVHSRAATSSVLQDFEMMRALVA